MSGCEFLRELQGKDQKYVGLGYGVDIKVWLL